VIPLVGCLLIACLMLATSVDGFLRASHEIARAGQTTLVICGQNGVGTVTLDRDGAPVAPTGTECAHCADCSLAPAFDVPPVVATAHGAVQVMPVAGVGTASFLNTHLAAKLPRGPPNQGSFLI
jgi:hypothetical protein